MTLLLGSGSSRSGGLLGSVAPGPGHYSTHFPSVSPTQLKGHDLLAVALFATWPWSLGILCWFFLMSAAH